MEVIMKVKWISVQQKGEVKHYRTPSDIREHMALIGTVYSRVLNVKADNDGFSVLLIKRGEVHTGHIKPQIRFIVGR